MKKERRYLILLMLWVIGQSIFAQSPLPRIYEYDAAGNRVLRKVLELKNLETDTSNNMLADNIFFISTSLNQYSCHE